MKAAIILFLGLSAGVLFAQQTPAAQLAGLVQDMSLLTRQVGQLRAEVDALTRENEELRRQVSQAGSAQTQATALAALRRDMDEQNAQTKKQILTEVSKQIDSLATQMQAAFDKLSRASGTQPTTPTTVSFSDDYSKDGVVYTVKAGDTLDRIARQFNANARDIQNANKIANPARDLRAGQNIFIPKAKE